MSHSTLRDRDTSPELGSPSKATQYHKQTGRPIRRSAGKLKPMAGYVDSKVIEDECGEPIELPSEDEDGGMVRRKRKRTPSPSPPPLDPIIRYEEPDDATDDELDIDKMEHEPPLPTFQFNIPLGFHGPLTVKLDRSLWLRDGAEGEAYGVQPRNIIQKPTVPIPSPQENRAVTAQGKGFTDMPPELRNKVYRHLFLHNHLFKFPPGAKSNLCRTAQFLSTCKLVHSEGCSILYGENAFYFDRNKHTRSPFWESIPREIGYTDIRRFLKMIGPENLAYVRDIWISLEDACPSSTPYLNHEQRRYINDDHLIDCLRILRGAKLKKITYSFGGRRNLYATDTKFLSYLEQIKADEVVKRWPFGSHWYQCKITEPIWSDIKIKSTRQKKLYAQT